MDTQPHSHDHPPSSCDADASAVAVAARQPASPSCSSSPPSQPPVALKPCSRRNSIASALTWSSGAWSATSRSASQYTAARACASSSPALSVVSIVAKPLSVEHTATLCTMLVHVGRTAKRDGNPQGGVYQAEEGGARAGAARAAGAPRRALDWRWNQG